MASPCESVTGLDPLETVASTASRVRANMSLSWRTSISIGRVTQARAAA